jgi:hypothetical protein
MDSSLFVHLFHILIVGGLFLYVGRTQTKLSSWIYPGLAILGGIIVAYHIYKAYTKKMAGQNPWVNYIHILLVGPLLVYIGLNRDKTERMYFELLLMFGFASIGYHGYYLVESL